MISEITKRKQDFGWNSSSLPVYEAQLNSGAELVDVENISLPGAGISIKSWIQEERKNPNEKNIDLERFSHMQETLIMLVRTPPL